MTSVVIYADIPEIGNKKNHNFWHMNCAMRVTLKSSLIILFKLIISIALAFPLCGLTSALIAIIRDPVVLLKDPSGTLFAIAVISLWDGLGAVATGGFPIADEAGINHTNMYPYIVLTACIIFLLLSKGWRWFRKRTTHQN